MNDIESDYYTSGQGTTTPVVSPPLPKDSFARSHGETLKMMNPTPNGYSSHSSKGEGQDIVKKHHDSSKNSEHKHSSDHVKKKDGGEVKKKDKDKSHHKSKDSSSSKDPSKKESSKEHKEKEHKESSKSKEGGESKHSESSKHSSSEEKSKHSEIKKETNNVHEKPKSDNFKENEKIKDKESKHKESKDKHKDKHKDKESKPHKDKSKKKSKDGEKHKEKHRDKQKHKEHKEKKEKEKEKIKVEVDSDSMKSPPPAPEPPKVKDEPLSEDDTPLAQQIPVKTKSIKREHESDEEEAPKPKEKKIKEKKKVQKKRKAYSDDDEDDDETKKPVKKVKKEVKKTPQKGKQDTETASPRKKGKKEEEQEVWKWWEEEKLEDGVKWKTLEHNGPVFAPPYEPVPSNVKFYYDDHTEPQLSLSIAETNKLRAKLGLKPLEVKSQIPGIESEDQNSTKQAEVFVKTENIREKKKAEDLREKLRVIKEKRAIEEKLRKTKGIADSDSEDDSPAAWVMKHQRMMQEKIEAEKRAKLLEEMDEEFGVGALVEEEFDKNKSYTSDNLKGLTVAHDVDSFKEGHQVILTLKDKGVLEEEDDVLENINIVDSERYAKNIENKKKKPDYMPYEEPEYDEFGILKKKNLLAKYDEEIEGEKKKTFRLGEVSSSSYVSREQELELIRMKLKQQNKMTLEMPEMKPANEYYTTEDMVQFKKPKKKKLKKVSVLKADDLLSEDAVGDQDLGSRRRGRKRDLDDDDEVPEMKTGIPLIHEEIDPKLDLANVKIEEDQEKELNSALNKAKKLKERKVMASAPEKVIEILNSVNGSSLDSQKVSKNAVNIELNSVAEFCRTLGEIPTYGMSGNRGEEEADDMIDYEKELLKERQKQELELQNQGAWNEVDVEEKPAEIAMRENEPILEEEPDISTGVVGALNLATKKGYLDKDDKKLLSAPRSSNLQAQSYTIEEKFYEDDKFGKRDRYTGPVQEFREKSNYKPDVKLEYIDDNGRLLTAKEAFRYLSHKFHGKGPGKNKVDKRMKKLEQDTRLKQMSSTDTPLNTVKLLQQKQKETQSPYIVLSGGNKTLTQTMISKSKPV